MGSENRTKAKAIVRYHHAKKMELGRRMPSQRQLTFQF